MQCRMGEEFMALGRHAHDHSLTRSQHSPSQEQYHKTQPDRQYTCSSTVVYMYMFMYMYM